MKSEFRLRGCVRGFMSLCRGDGWRRALGTYLLLDMSSGLVTILSCIDIKSGM